MSVLGAQPPLEVNQSLLKWSTLVATLVGTVASCVFNENSSPRSTMKYADLLFAIGCFLNMVEVVPSVQALGQTVMALGSGIAIVTIPLFILEELPTPLQDGIINLCGLLQAVGPTLQYILILKAKQVAGLIATVLPVAHLLLLMFMEENPLRLMMKGEEARSRERLSNIVLPCEVEQEVISIKVFVGRKKKKIASHSTFSNFKIALRSRVFRLSLIRGVAPILISQSTGFQLVIYFKKLYVDLAHISQELEFGISLTIFCVIFVIDLLLIEALGIRLTMLISLLFISVDLFLLGFAFTVNESPKSILVILILLEIYMFFYSLGLSSLPMLLNMKLYEGSHINLGASTAGFVNCLVGGATAITLFPVNSNLKKPRAFRVYCAIAVTGIIALYCLLPDERKSRKKKMDVEIKKKSEAKEGIQLPWTDTVYHIIFIFMRYC
ncbi:inositol transporter 1-like [Castanea sativa]|uniref:inositol transporter 1-like n=1 Tax=Castanea sativa TaxID=21020 RepID=UPI003F64C9FB